MSDADPSALSLVRLHRSMTQTDLASASGFSQAWISNAEAGSVAIAPERATELARILRCSPALILAPPGSVRAGGVVHHRKRQSLPAKALARVRSTLRLSGIYGSRLLAFAGAAPPIELTQPSSDLFGPEEAAMATRERLGLDDGPIRSVVDSLEHAGVVVASMAMDTPKLDAVASWAPDDRPSFLLNASCPGDRARFSTAHELGHVVLHRVVPDDPEGEADRFASQFLMPESSIRAELSSAPISLSVLGRLKTRWGVSMAALLRRARDLGATTESDYRSLVIEMSRAGYRTAEPIIVPNERPSLVCTAVHECLAAGAEWDELEVHTLATRAELEEMFCGD